MILDCIIGQSTTEVIRELDKVIQKRKNRERKVRQARLHSRMNSNKVDIKPSKGI